MKQYLPLLTAFEKAAQEALTEHGGAVMAESNRRAPRETGETEGTALVQVEDLTVTAGYTSFIARLQHENLEYEHRDGREAKFLEHAAEEMQPQLAATIERNLRAVFGDG